MRDIFKPKNVNKNAQFHPKTIPESDATIRANDSIPSIPIQDKECVANIQPVVESATNEAPETSKLHPATLIQDTESVAIIEPVVEPVFDSAKAEVVEMPKLNRVKVIRDETNDVVVFDAFLRIRATKTWNDMNGRLVRCQLRVNQKGQGWMLLQRNKVNLIGSIESFTILDETKSPKAFEIQFIDSQGFYVDSDFSFFWKSQAKAFLGEMTKMTIKALYHARNGLKRFLCLEPIKSRGLQGAPRLIQQVKFKKTFAWIQAKNDWNRIGLLDLAIVLDESRMSPQRFVMATSSLDSGMVFLSVELETFLDGLKTIDWSVFEFTSENFVYRFSLESDIAYRLFLCGLFEPCPRAFVPETDSRTDGVVSEPSVPSLDDLFTRSIIKPLTREMLARVHQKVQNNLFFDSEWMKDVVSLSDTGSLIKGQKKFGAWLAVQDDHDEWHQLGEVKMWIFYFVASFKPASRLLLVLSKDGSKVLMSYKDWDDLENRTSYGDEAKGVNLTIDLNGKAYRYQFEFNDDMAFKEFYKALVTPRSFPKMTVPVQKHVVNHDRNIFTLRHGYQDNGRVTLRPAFLNGPHGLMVH